MFGFLKSALFTDSALGELRYARGAWRGHIDIGQPAPVPLAIAGDRKAPDGAALRVARTLATDLPTWGEAIGRALHDHYQPYADAAADDADATDFPKIARPEDVWPHASIVHVAVMPLAGGLAVEIGYRTDWDEEHTLGARLRDGTLIELNGSVIAP